MSSSNNKENKNLIAKILDIFFRNGDPEREKKRILKGIEDQLRKKAKYYRTANHQLQPALGKFFYDIYCVIGPAKILLQNLSKSDQLKNIVVEAFLDENRKKIITSLVPDEIKRRVTGRSSSEVQEELKKECSIVTSFISNDSMANQINLSYAYMKAFNEFINFDFYHFVKQFDADIPDRNYTYKPRFEAVPGESLVNDIDEFLHLALPIIGDINWDRLFDILKDYRNSEIIHRDGWRKSVNNIREMIKSETLELIVRSIKEDPFYEAKITISATDIVRPYVTNLKTTVDNYIKQLGQNEKNKAVNKICMEIFGKSSLPSILNNYTREKHEMMFAKRNISGFTYAEMLNAVLTFGDDYLNKDMKILVDLLILKGKWSQNIHYKDFSHSFQELLTNYEACMKFDNSVAEESSGMVRLRNALRSGERDKFAINTVKGILGEINDEAHDLITSAMQNYVIMGRCLKLYIEDYKLQPKSEIIINWKEIEKNSEKPLAKFMAEMYTKIYYLIQMFQYYNQDE